MNLLNSSGLVFERLYDSKLRRAILFASQFFIKAFPKNLISFKLFSATCSNLPSSVTDALFLRLVSNKNWTDFQRFESLLNSSKMVSLSPATIRLFYSSLSASGPDRFLGAYLLSLQDEVDANHKTKAISPDFVYSLEGLVKPEIMTKLLISLGVEGWWDLADEKLVKLIEVNPDDSAKKAIASLRSYPSSGVRVAIIKRYGDQHLPLIGEDRNSRISKRDVLKLSPNKAIHSLYRWQQYKSAHELGQKHLDRIGETEKIRVWKSSILSHANKGPSAIASEVESRALETSKHEFFRLMSTTDTKGTFLAPLETNPNFQMELERSRMALKELSFSSDDLSLLSYGDKGFLEEMIDKIFTSTSPDELDSTQIADLLRRSKSTSVEKDKESKYSELAIRKKNVNPSLILRSAEHLEFSKLQKLLLELHDVKMSRFFNFPAFAGLASLNHLDEDGQLFISGMTEFWTSRKSYGVSRFETVSIAHREALLSRFLHSHPDEISQVAAGTNFSDLHLNHRMASAIKNFGDSNFEVALDLSAAVAQENPAWNLARTFVSHAALRSESPNKLKENFYFQKQLGSDDDFLDNASHIAGLAAGYFNRSETLAHKQLLWQSPLNFLGYSDLEDIGWKSDSILIFENQGVSDEVRNVQELRELNRISKDVTVVCEPRLEPILSESFKNISFVPFERAHRDWRSPKPNKTKWGSLLERFIPEDLLENMSSFDAILPSLALTNERLKGRKYPVVGGYLAADSNRFSNSGSSGKLRVGLVWRSGHSKGLRAFQYHSLEQVLEPLSKLYPMVEVHSIQHLLSSDERKYLDDKRAVVNEEVDFFNDFKSVADYCASLDVVIGISTSGTEIAASVGTPVLMLGATPENYYMRTAGGQTKRDVLTANSEIIGPRGTFNRDSKDVLEDVMSEVIARIKTHLNDPTKLLLSKYEGQHFPPPLVVF